VEERKTCLAYAERNQTEEEIKWRTDEEKQAGRSMKRLHVIGVVAFLAVSALGAFLWMSYFDTTFALKHDTNGWAVIMDREGSRVAE
jgi:hypothetical protein